ncbi:hypothetical protein AB0J86_09845 [Micromonospora sp. NPDC049559]|uniref:hypothetical protein n=1 Tax=Micromonospora sp. NPDC049559 TaxID=3155923 RepID=UPI003417F0AB
MRIPRQPAGDAAGPEPPETFVPVAVGNVLRLTPGNYVYGTGPLHVGDGELRLRVIHVPRGLEAYAGEWVSILGVEVLPNGEDGRHLAVAVRCRPLEQPGSG